MSIVDVKLISNTITLSIFWQAFCTFWEWPNVKLSLPGKREKMNPNLMSFFQSGENKQIQISCEKKFHFWPFLFRALCLPHYDSVKGFRFCAPLNGTKFKRMTKPVSNRFLTCGQSYKFFTLGNYESRVVISSKLLLFTTLEL